MGLNGLLGFKGPTHLMPTQTHPFDTLTHTQPPTLNWIANGISFDQMEFELIVQAPHKKSRCIFSIRWATAAGMGKRDKK
jgi:hypothetical protein